MIGAGIGALLAWPAPGRAPALRGEIGFDPLSLLRGVQGFPGAPAREDVAAPFVLRASGPDKALAIRCLADAVYYEAAEEPLEGRRAVAQVVLNRLRDPHFPKSVCGVVYEGRAGGANCQFSFACNGATQSAPPASAYQNALVVAREALAGRVEPSAGLSTHYHAMAVAPAWRAAMVKVARIGSQMFYRWPGAAGRIGAFSGRYAGGERIPAAGAPGEVKAPALAAVALDAAAGGPVPVLWGRRARTRQEIAQMNQRLEAIRPSVTTP